MKTFTVTIARDIGPAAALGFPCAYLTYSADSGVLRMSAPPAGKGGILGLLTDGASLSQIDINRLASDITAQIKRRGFGGLLIDMPANEESAWLTSHLSHAMASQGIVHFVPIDLAYYAPNGKYVIPSAISGGSFAEMLDHYLGLYPPSSLCLDLVRSRNDFLMPSHDPEGRPLSRQEFDALYERSGGGYYSRELCCRYFTYNKGVETHFVMFDDRETARHKCGLARGRGFFACFALYGEWGTDIRYIFG